MLAGWSGWFRTICDSLCRSSPVEPFQAPCRHFLGNQSKGVRLVPTLFYEFTLCMLETKLLIENALIDNPSLLNRPLEHQFQRLIIDPILALPNPKLLGSPMRIAIDALNECDDHEFIPQLIGTIAQIDHSKFPINFLFTGRGKEHICKIFESMLFNHMIYQLSLSNTAFNVYRDMEHYLQSQFSIINLDSWWKFPCYAFTIGSPSYCLEGQWIIYIHFYINQLYW